MRTKNLLLSAAALVAGALSVQAQSNVYSVNVVGYVNIPFAQNALSLIATPLDNGTNNLTSLFPNAANGSQVQVWNGAGFQVAQKTFGNWNTNLVVPPGTGFFFKSGSNMTNTFVGNVAVSTGATNTIALPANTLVLVGSPLPIADNLTGTNLNLQLANGSQIQVWNGSGFQVAQKTFGNWNTNLNISVGQGFFLKSATATNWVQTLR